MTSRRCEIERSITAPIATQADDVWLTRTLTIFLAANVVDCADVVADARIAAVWIVGIETEKAVFARVARARHGVALDVDAAIAAVDAVRVVRAIADAASERRVVGARIGFLATVALLTDERRIVERSHVTSVVEKRLATIAARSIRARRRCAIALVDWIGKGRFDARRSEAVAAASSRYPQISNCKKFCTLDSRKLSRVISQLNKRTTDIASGAKPMNRRRSIRVLRKSCKRNRRAGSSFSRQPLAYHKFSSVANGAGTQRTTSEYKVDVDLRRNWKKKRCSPPSILPCLLPRQDWCPWVRGKGQHQQDRSTQMLLFH